jgi:hypothetical protein
MANFEFAYDLGGGNRTPVVRKLPVATTQTLLYGMAVVMSSGQLAKAGDGSSVVVGIMAQDAVLLDAGTLVEVHLVQPWQVWRATASADASSNVLDGERAYDLAATTQLVNLADTTGGSLQIVDIDEDDNTAIYVQFLAPFFG